MVAIPRRCLFLVVPALCVDAGASRCPTCESVSPSTRHVAKTLLISSPCTGGPSPSASTGLPSSSLVPCVRAWRLRCYNPRNVCVGLFGQDVLPWVARMYGSATEIVPELTKWLSVRLVLFQPAKATGACSITAAMLWGLVHFWQLHSDLGLKRLLN